MNVAADIILEPQRRDSAVAVALHAAARDPAAVVLILSADHVVVTTRPSWRRFAGQRLGPERASS